VVKVLFFTFLRTLKKMLMHTLIELKPGTHKGCIKAILSTNFGGNLIKIFYSIMTNYSCKHVSCNSLTKNELKLAV